MEVRERESFIQWYRILLDDQMLMSAATENSPPTLLPVRAETLNPGTDWENSWRLIRLKGMSSKNSSFLFKLLHLLLPTQTRVRRFGAARDGEDGSGQCLLCGEENEDLHHSYFACPHTAATGLYTLGLTQKITPGLTAEAALRLELGDGLDEEQELAAVSMIATGLSFIWDRREKKKHVTLYQTQAKLVALISILRSS